MMGSLGKANYADGLASGIGLSTGMFAESGDVLLIDGDDG